MAKDHNLQQTLKELEDAKALLNQQQVNTSPYSPYGPTIDAYKHNKNCLCSGCAWEKVQTMKSQIIWETVPVPPAVPQLTPKELAILAKLPANPLYRSSSKLEPMVGMVVSLKGGPKTFLSPDWIALYRSNSTFGRSLQNYWTKGSYAIYYTTRPKTRFSITK